MGACVQTPVVQRQQQRLGHVGPSNAHELPGLDLGGIPHQDLGELLRALIFHVPASLSGSLGSPSAGALGSPAAGALGSPSAGSLGSPSAGSLGSPSAGSLGSPSARLARCSLRYRRGTREGMREVIS